MFQFWDKYIYMGKFGTAGKVSLTDSFLVYVIDLECNIFRNPIVREIQLFSEEGHVLYLESLGNGNNYFRRQVMYCIWKVWAMETIVFGGRSCIVFGKSGHWKQLFSEAGHVLYLESLGNGNNYFLRQVMYCIWKVWALQTIIFWSRSCIVFGKSGNWKQLFSEAGHVLYLESLGNGNNYFQRQAMYCIWKVWAVETIFLQYKLLIYEFNWEKGILFHNKI